MPCASSSSTLEETRTVWSDGTTTAIFFVFFFRMSVAEWGKARISIFMEGSSGLLTVTSAGVYGDEESDFASGTVVDIPTTPTSATANGSAWGASFAPLDATRQGVSIGVKVKNTSGTKIEQARVTIKVDVGET